MASPAIIPAPAGPRGPRAGCPRHRGSDLEGVVFSLEASMFSSVKLGWREGGKVAQRCNIWDLQSGPPSSPGERLQDSQSRAVRAPQLPSHSPVILVHR